MPLTLVKLPLQERVRAKLRDLVQRGDVSLDVLGTHLGLSRSGVSRIINEEGYSILLPHLETLCFFFQVSPAELVAEPGSLVQTVRPLEAQLLTHFRAMTELQRHSLLAILERPLYEAGKKRRARLGHAELTTEQQLLVELYAQSEPQAREGVLKILRGTAKRRSAAKADTTG